MRIPNRFALRAFATFALCLTGSGAARAVPGALLPSFQGGGQSEWTGTITVTESAAGTIRGGTTVLGFVANRSVTFTLNGDGTAQWTGRFTSTIDASGIYKLPTTGGGSGFGHAGASFDGVWTVYADPEGDMPTVTDHSGEDRAFLTQGPGAIAVEIAKAMGQPPPTPGNRKEKGFIGVLAAAVPVRAAATATSLSGSTSETVRGGADRMGGPGTIPSTITYSWNLHKGTVQPHVKIYGPECGCIDPDSGDTTLHFVAGASPRGGEFSEFLVTSDGPMPDIISNTGGESPSLEISGTKDTGSVTLKIRYTRNGQPAESAPFKVDFCAIDQIELKDNDTDLAFDLSGELEVDAKSKLWRGGKEVSAELEWELDDMGSPTSLSAEPSSKKTGHIKFTYRNLPKDNSDFGEKTLTAKTSGKCACQREQTIRAFFIPEVSDHPDDSSPNWFYYWKQTDAAPAAFRKLITYQASVFDPNLGANSIAMYDHKTEKVLISKAVFDAHECKEPDGSTRDAEGIDCFGETVRHELQHRTDAIDWWGGPRGPYEVSLFDWFTKDWDHDLVPNQLEQTLAGCKPGTALDSTFDAAKVLLHLGDLVETGKKTWFTCSNRPFTKVTDAEINAYYEGWKWPMGSANGQDWSCGDRAKQWGGKKCGS